MYETLISSDNKISLKANISDVYDKNTMDNYFNNIKSTVGPKGDSIIGPQGESIIGPQGVKGDSIVGPRGEKGNSITGLQGMKGDSITGPQGAKGDSITGPQGEKGDSIIGPRGAAGISYVSNDLGEINQILQGAQGVKGDSIIGPRGVQGIKGDSITGPQGEKGNSVTGPQGIKGDSIIGPQGIKGDSIIGPQGVSIIGPQGVKGDSIIGPQGLKGDAIIGPQGLSIIGPQGLKGDTGLQGIKGVSNIAGPQGIKGDTGLDGQRGEKGDDGENGFNGFNGANGTNGIGIKGDTGLSGNQGIKGDTGLSGNQGIKGDEGLAGVQGLKGDTGLSGSQGSKGDTGLSGNQGSKGDTGLFGNQGIKGDTGLTGPSGSTIAGTVITPLAVNITTSADIWPAMQIKNNSDTATTPAEIVFNRGNKGDQYISAIGITGSATRGAYWWCGGSDRINIICLTGEVKIATILSAPTINSTDLTLTNNLVVKTVNILNTLNLKADALNVYTKSSIDTTLDIMRSNYANAINGDFFRTLSVKTSTQNGGNIKIKPTTDGNESSIGYYNRVDLRETISGDVWVVGVNCWNKPGYSIGTPVLGYCLNIDLFGNVIVNSNLFINQVNVLTTLNSKANALNVYTISNIDTKFTTSNGLISNKLNSATGLNSSLYIRSYDGAAIITINDSKLVALSSNLNVGGAITTTRILVKDSNSSAVIGNSVNQTIAEFYENKTV